MSTFNVASVSSGKDSTVLIGLMQALEVENQIFVFADTNNEDPQVYDYLDYLEVRLGISIRRVRADFTADIARKRAYVAAKWPLKGVPDHVVQRALEVLHPTGNAYLDLCIMKGRFPSRMAQFCTQELKVKPIFEQVFIPLMDSGDHMILSWQGVRLEESVARRNRLQGTGACVKAVHEVGGGLFNYMPILRWSAADVFQAHKDMGIKPNPLYTQGMNRVGCMPCINCSKEELATVAKRFPEAIARIREWEALVGMASKHGAATFFASVNDPTVSACDVVTADTHGIDRMVEWAKTTRGGRQYDIFFAQPGEETGCSSSYGLCEGAA